MNGKRILLLLVSAVLIIGCGEKAKDKEIDVAPRITLIGPTEVFFNVDDVYIEYGYTATDVDGNDVTSLVRRDTSTLNMGKEGSYQVSYVAVDRKGVKSDAVYRTVNVGDAFAPEITISGSNPLLVKLNGEFSQPAATAVAYDGTDLSDSIEVNAESVDTTKVGTYIVSYTVTDSSGVTGTAQLYVYVLESSSPRIIVEGTGAIEENPYPLQVQGASADDAAVKSYLNKAIPYFEAYDLEDGDISYKVSVSEDDTYNSLIAALKSDAATEGTVYALSLTVSDSDGNTPSPLPVFYVTVVTDTTPPVITLDNEQAMYTIEIDAWNDNTAAWNKLFQDLGAKVTDNSWEDQTPKQFSPNTTVEGLAANGIEDAELKAALTMNGDRTKFAANYDANNAAAPLNYKKVTLWATDKAGNKGTKEITVYLTDTTAPEIIKSNITIPFGVSSISDNYKLKWQDNSGAEGTCSGLALSDIDNALTEGSFNVTFTATHTNNPSKTSTLTYAVRVGSPLTGNAGGGKNIMQNNIVKNANFEGTQYTGASEGFSNMTPMIPANWQLYDTDNFWHYYSWGRTGKSTIDNLAKSDRGDLVAGGVKYSTLSAYLVAGCRDVDTNTWVKHQQVRIDSVHNVVLYPTVTYHFGFDAISYQTHGSDFTEGDDRNVIFMRESGAGTIGGATSVKESFMSTDSVANIGKNDMYKLMQSNPKLAETTTYKTNWQEKAVEATIQNDRINSVRIRYEVLAPSDTGKDSRGALLSNVRIIPVKWSGKKDRQDPASQKGWYAYDLSSGAVTWSEN